MYITTRELKCFGKVIPAGRPIPDPDRWDVCALQSNLNIGWVREASQEEEKAILETLPQEGGVKAHSESEAKRLEAQGAKLATFACEKCPDKFFKSGAGLKSHIRAAHHT